MILLMIILLPLAWLVVFRARRRRLYELAALLPKPSDEAYGIGVTHKLMGTTEDIINSLQKFSLESMYTGGIIRGWLGHILYVLVINPLDAEFLLKTCMEKDDLHRFLRKVIGYGGIFAPVPIWRRRRKILVPAFSPKIVESFAGVFSEQGQKLVKRLDCKVEKGTFSIWPYLSSYTLDSVCETAMGVKINSQDDVASPFLTSMNRLLHLVCQRIFHLWQQPDILYERCPQYPEHQKCIKLLHDFTDEVITKKRQEMKAKERDQGLKDNEKEFDLEDYKQKTFLDLLISISGGEKGYTDLELREEVLTLTIAGTDTSAVATGYTLQLLAKYPDIQEKLYQELREVFGDSDRSIVKDDLVSLKYLERVIKESLRLYPPVPFIIRKVEEEMKLPSGVVLPAGCGVVVSIWGCHRDHNYWGPDAQCFDPDRFLPERLNIKHPCSYMPFSNGPRNCVGYQYALMSVKTAVASVIRNFKVVGEKEATKQPFIRVKLDIMMKAVDGYQLALERRTSVSNTTSRKVA